MTRFMEFFSILFVQTVPLRLPIWTIIPTNTRAWQVQHITIHELKLIKKKYYQTKEFEKNHWTRKLLSVRHGIMKMGFTIKWKSAYMHTFIPVKAKPRKILQHCFLRFPRRPFQVSILNPQDEFPTFWPEIAFHKSINNNKLLKTNFPPLSLKYGICSIFSFSLSFTQYH